MATRGQQKTKAELTRLEKEAEKRSEERQKKNSARSKAEMERRTGSNARLSKKELTKKELEAERKSRVKPGEGRGLKEFLKRESEARTKKAPKSGTRRAKVQSRRVAEKNIPKAVRDLMVSPKQDAQNKADSKLRTANRRQPSKSAIEQMIKDATDKAKSGIKSASRVGSLAKGMTGLGALFSASEVGKGSDVVPAGRRDEFVKKMDAERKAKEKKKTTTTSSKDATKRSDRALAAKAKAYKKTGEAKYRHGVSGGGVPFKEAFAYWKNKGAKTFTWNGKKYSTETK